MILYNALKSNLVFKRSTRLSLQRTIFFILILGFTACAGQYKESLNFNPEEPLRVAVLPFVQLDQENKIIEGESRLFTDNLDLDTNKGDLSPAQIVRKAVLSELSESGLDLVSSALVDIDLPHRGLASSDGKINLEKLLKTDPKQICNDFLNCDALLYGTIKRWDRSYYGVQSVNSIELELKLVSVVTNRVLFFATATDSESRGITKIPTGISSVVLEPLRGLDSEIIENLAQQMVAKMLKSLRIDSRPAFLESSPPVIYATSYFPEADRIDRNQPLIVLAYGSANQTATFSIGTVIKNIPMIERSPGHYYGEYLPLDLDRFSNSEVRVEIRDRFGRKSHEAIALGGISLE